MNISNNITQLVGNTPMLRLVRVAEGAAAEVYAKLEYFNPSGSVKDRAARNMIRRAEEDGTLKSGGTIVEPTSGNTGIGLALAALPKGYRLILTMPASMSEERKTLLRGLGAELILTEPTKGMSGAISEADRIIAETRGAVSMRQFDNPANAEAHYLTTAEEIWRDMAGRVDILVSAVGTGGTITGTTRRLKEYNPALRALAVEPAESPVLSGGKPAPHPIQGIGAGFVPSILDRALIDEIVQVSGPDAIAMARRLIREEGVFCGISSGAAAAAALAIAQNPENAGKRIVFFACDTSDRYLSTALFADAR